LIFFSLLAGVLAGHGASFEPSMAPMLLAIVVAYLGLSAANLISED